jgi:hypothetical protein
MNHQQAWCMETIDLGCQTYSVSKAIAIMRHNSSHDKTYTLAPQLIAAKLNIACGNSNPSCIMSAINAADSWLCQHPIGSGVTANSAAWQQIKATSNQLEKYNEGMLCAPSCGGSDLQFAPPVLQ